MGRIHRWVFLRRSIGRGLGVHPALRPQPPIPRQVDWFVDSLAMSNTLCNLVLILTPIPTSFAVYTYCRIFASNWLDSTFQSISDCFSPMCSVSAISIPQGYPSGVSGFYLFLLWFCGPATSALPRLIHSRNDNVIRRLSSLSIRESGWVFTPRRITPKVLVYSQPWLNCLLVRYNALWTRVPLRTSWEIMSVKSTHGC